MDFVAPQSVRSSLTRDWICVSCIDRWILYHRATREDFSVSDLMFLFSPVTWVSGKYIHLVLLTALHFTLENNLRKKKEWKKKSLPFYTWLIVFQFQNFLNLYAYSGKQCTTPPCSNSEIIRVCAKKYRMNRLHLQKVESLRGSLCGLMLKECTC